LAVSSSVYPVQAAQATLLKLKVSDCAELTSVLKDPITGSPSELVVELQSGFATSMADGTCTAVYTDDPTHAVPLSVDGSEAGDLVPKAGERLLDLTNSSGQVVTLTGLTITQDGDPAAPISSGDGVLRLRDGDWELRDSVIEKQTNVALRVGGHGSVSITNTIFRKNSSGRALLVDDHVDANIEDSSFIENSGGAVTLGGGSEQDFTKHRVTTSNFDKNTATGAFSRGGAIYSRPQFADISITKSVFTDNKVIGIDSSLNGNNKTIDGGAIALYCNNTCSSAANPARSVISDSYFEGNFAQDDGGAILIEGGIKKTSIKNDIVNNTFVGNTAAGAQYGKKISFLSIAVTDASGGAISYYGMTDSRISHNMFHKNGITNATVGSVSTLGSVGGGGAVGVDSDESQVKSPKDLPAVPVVSNNVFLANYINKPIPQSSMDTVLDKFIGRKAREKTGNVFVLDGTDADLLDVSQPLRNNGNIGWDNRDYRDTGYDNNGVAPNQGIVPENVYAHLDDSGEPVLRDGPTKDGYGDPVGADGATAKRHFYIVSPTSDELYRDGSGPYYVADVRKDVRGYERDHYPNAGPVEIYWTKFDPGVATGGAWTKDIPKDAIESLKAKGVYYRITQPKETLEAFPRSAITNSDPDWGFVGWQSDQPETPGGTDFPIYQPQDEVTSSKQKLTAVWEQQKFRVDFDLNYKVDDVPQLGTPMLHVPKGSAIDAPTEPSRGEKYRFDGWFQDSALTRPWDFTQDKVEGDLMLYAKWAPKTVVVRFLDDGKEVFVGRVVNYGEMITDPGVPPHPDGKVFLGWHLGDVKYDFKAPVLEDLDLEARWGVAPPSTPTDSPTGKPTDKPTDKPTSRPPGTSLGSPTGTPPRPTGSGHLPTGPKTPPRVERPGLAFTGFGAGVGILTAAGSLVLLGLALIARNRRNR
jgi:uncharacterized repeat protein (TIGR02543 family)